MTTRIRFPTGQATPRPSSPRSQRPVTKAIEVLEGYVREIVDGRTIDLNLLRPTPDQLERYQGSELVRLVGLAVEALAPERAEDDLRVRLHQRIVRCFVHGRDDAGRLIAVAVPVAKHRNAS